MLDRFFNPLHYWYNPHAIPVLIAGAGIFFIGLFILWQTKKTVKNVSFFLFCMSSSLWLVSMSIVYSANNPQTALAWYKLVTFWGVINLMPNLYLFSTASSGLLDKQRPYVIGSYILSYTIYILALTTGYFITTPTYYFWGYYPHYEPLTYIFLGLFLVMFAASQINLRLAYKIEPIPVKKSQIKTIIVSLLFGITAFIDFVPKVFVVSIYPVGFISMFLLACFVAYSIIKYKAFDIETVIHKTILWILSFLMITIPVFSLYQWLFPIMNNSLYAQLAFGITSFVVFAVYLRLIQPKIDHFFQRRKADLDEISRRFTQDLVYLKGLDNLVRYIERTITSTMYPQGVHVYIYNEREKKYISADRRQAQNRVTEFSYVDEFLQWLNKNNKIVYREFIEIDPIFTDIKKQAKEYFCLTQAVVAIPLVLNDQLLGVINLGKKANLSRYNALDFNFLTALKNQSAIAISNSLIYQNIEEQVSQRTAELVEVQRQLIQVEKMATIGTLSGGVAHEINNPLMAILTNVQMLLVTCDDDGTRVDRESLQLMEEATQRCRSIVQKLMTYSKKPLESGETTMINLSGVLDKVIAFLKFQLEQEDIKIVADIERGNCFVMGNHNELEQVLTNIILNARDAIAQVKKKGQIHIALLKAGHQCKITIKDQGGGIPKDVISKIFDPFFTTKDVGKGLGMGLSICQSIIDKHKGQITVQSEVGSGATFTVELPWYSQAMAPCNVSPMGLTKIAKKI